jgi:hypothetical protein
VLLVAVSLSDPPTELSPPTTGEGEMLCGHRLRKGILAGSFLRLSGDRAIFAKLVTLDESSPTPATAMGAAP